MILKDILQHRKMFLTSNFYNLLIKRMNNNSEKDGKINKENKPKDLTLENDPLGRGVCLPEEPSTCCGSGCPNCVWVEYASQMSQYFGDGGENAKNIIMERVQDENMKTFLLMELRTMKLNKK